MWVWVSIAAGLVVCVAVFTVYALRAWRQVKALRSSLTSVRSELESYAERLQVGQPGARHN